MKTTITVEFETKNIEGIKEEESGTDVSKDIEESLHKAFVDAVKESIKNEYVEELMFDDIDISVEDYEYLYDYGDVLIIIDEEVVYDSKKAKAEEEKAEKESEIEDDLGEGKSLFDENIEEEKND